MSIDTPSTEKTRKLALLTGMSGAGLSTALKAFEDLGYEAVDNLRLGLVEDLVAHPTGGAALAVSIDTRNTNFSVEELLRVYNRLKAREGYDVRLVFLECSDEALLRRFTETRRRHPMAKDRPVADGIHYEREALRVLKDEADQVIDTSVLSIHDLRRLIAGHFGLNDSVGLSVFVTSFSYRHGVPRESDLVFDVRFLLNPHWETKLRPLTGLDTEIQEYVKKDKDYQSFMDHLVGLITPLLPRYQLEGKSYLTIAIGCSGGRHRSVVVAEELSNYLASQGYIVGLAHRDLERSSGKA